MKKKTCPSRKKSTSTSIKQEEAQPKSFSNFKEYYIERMPVPPRKAVRNLKRTGGPCHTGPVTLRGVLRTVSSRGERTLSERRGATPGTVLETKKRVTLLRLQLSGRKGRILRLIKENLGTRREGRS